MIGTANQVLSGTDAGSKWPARVLMRVVSTSPNTDNIYVSDNSLTWSTYTTPAWPASIYPEGGLFMTYNRMFFYFPNDGAQHYYTSVDGITWTTRTSLPINRVYNAFDGFIIGYNNSNGLTSVFNTTDGLTWTFRNAWTLSSGCLIRNSLQTLGNWGIITSAFDAYYSMDSGSTVNHTVGSTATNATTSNLIASNVGTTYDFLYGYRSSASDIVRAAGNGVSYNTATLSVDGSPKTGLSIAGYDTSIILSGKYYTYDGATYIFVSPSTILDGQAGKYANGYFIKACVTNGTSVKLQTCPDSVNWTTNALSFPTTATVKMASMSLA